MVWTMPSETPPEKILQAQEYANLSPQEATEKMLRAGVSFEDALRCLSEQVAALEQSDLGLDEAIAVYAFGAQLRRFCEKKLREAEMKIEQLTVSADKAAETRSPDN